MRKSLFLALLFFFVQVTSLQASGPAFVARLLRLHGDVVRACDEACVQTNLAAAPELAELVTEGGPSQDDIVRAWVSFNFQLGEEFRLENNSAPGPEWWQGTHRDRLALFAWHLGVSP